MHMVLLVSLVYITISWRYLFDIFNWETKENKLHSKKKSKLVVVDITLTVVMRQVIAWELQPFFLSCFFFSSLFFCLFRSAQLLSKQTKGTAQRLFNSLQVLNKLAWLNKDTSGTSINKRHRAVSVLKCKHIFQRLSTSLPSVYFLL